MDVFRRASNVVVVCVTILIGLALAGVIVLAALGRNSDMVEHLITTVLNGLGVVAGTGAWLYASAGANTSKNVEKQLNGNLDKRIADALAQHESDEHGD